MKIKLQNVRLSFPSLFRKAVFQGETTKYEATFLISKDDAVVEEIKGHIADLVKEKFKGKKLPADKMCLKHGEDTGRPEYEGFYTIKASNSKRPLVLDKDKSPLTEDDEKIYSGCYVNAIIELWAQDNQFGKRINANLLGVQFFKGGEPFSGGESASADDFDMFDDDGDDEDMFA